MADVSSIIQSLVSGVLTGGASAGTTLLAVFRDLKKRLNELEAKVGSDKSEPKSGLFLAIELLSEAQRKIRREIDAWEDDPPDWIVRAARRSSVSMETQQELEQRVEQRLRAFSQVLKRFEEEMDHRETELKRSASKTVFLTRSEYEEDSKLRAAEMAKVRENLSSSNVWLRGILSALGYIDPEPTTQLKLPPPKRK